ncbi:HXXEE domain-containing protein [uncultured Draconibacterium sp.]|uniref:HXXEE domain-containing protein n=1 Tax=uncultured Draconibacterium sp. TaxID=1573823 RepID=UPI0032179190
MKFYRQNWYFVGGILFVALAFFMGFWGNLFSHIQQILIYSFMAVLVHQFEEYVYPGGFPAIFNIAANGEKNVSDRYPLNANLSCIINVFLAYTFYIVPIFLPNNIWLGLAQVMFGMFQIFIHGIQINSKLKSIYNPGLGAVVFLHWPIGVYYIWYVITNNLASMGDFAIGIIATLIGVVLMIKLPFILFKSKESKFPFSEDRMYGYAKEKVLIIKNSETC